MDWEGKTAQLRDWKLYVPSQMSNAPSRACRVEARMSTGRNVENSGGYFDRPLFLSSSFSTVGNCQRRQMPVRLIGLMIIVFVIWSCWHFLPLDNRPLASAFGLHAVLSFGATVHSNARFCVKVTSSSRPRVVVLGWFVDDLLVWRLIFAILRIILCGWLDHLPSRMDYVDHARIIFFFDRDYWLDDLWIVWYYWIVIRFERIVRVEHSNDHQCPAWLTEAEDCLGFVSRTMVDDNRSGPCITTSPYIPVSKGKEAWQTWQVCLRVVTDYRKMRRSLIIPSSWFLIRRCCSAVSGAVNSRLEDCLSTKVEDSAAEIRTLNFYRAFFHRPILSMQN